MKYKLKWVWDKVKTHFDEAKEIYFFLGLIKLGLASLGIEILPDDWALVENIFNLLMVIGVYFGVFKYNPQTDGNLISSSKAVQFVSDLLKAFIKK